MYLIFDTETTGLPNNYNASFKDIENWPRMVQLAWQLHETSGELIEAKDFIIRPKGFDIPFNASKIHRITTERAQREGMPLEEILEIFQITLSKTHFLVGHNIRFDINIVGCEFFRLGWTSTLLEKKIIDTKEEAVDYCALTGGIGRKFKWPNLTELHQKLFGAIFSQAHNAVTDVEATARCFLELLRLKIISAEKFGIDISAIEEFRKKNIQIIQHTNNYLNQEKIIKDKKHQYIQEVKPLKNELQNLKLKKKFVHLHNHTAFSILSATTDIPSLIDRVLQWNMASVGITDSGNMMGAFYFLNAIEAANARILKRSDKDHNYTQIKGVIGCELFLSEDYLQKKFTKDQPDRRYKQVLLAKNKRGYHHLAKLCSEGYIKGYYAGCPRVGKELIVRYKEDLIALTGDLNAEIPYTILNRGESQAEEIFKWWHELFKDDFYVELLRHGLQEEDHVNEILLKMARKYGVKYIVQNNTFYLEKKDANAHDILLCVRDGEKQSTPIGVGRGHRFGLGNQEFYFKNSHEMIECFADIPEAFDYLDELVEKIDTYSLNREILLPKFKIPIDFINPLDDKDGKKRGENTYLRHLVFEGARKRYKNLNGALIERLDFELKTIEKIGYPGYFLIVQDFVKQAKKMNISVGPGRGSVAGSLVAYCTGITNIDPIKYDLLFERFLNPDRISLPDIDMDFDDRGRDHIIEWVVNKYGSHQVAQIITYGCMAAKSAIRDTARVLNLPLTEADRLAKMMPTIISLKELLTHSRTQLSEKLNSEDLERALKLQQICKKKNSEAEVLQQASILEGSVRNTGVHACGIIITPYDITEYVPMSISKDSNLLLTQFDNNVVESAGLLKIDFLGLKTLTIIKDTVELLQKKRGIKLHIDQISLEDRKTYELFQKGDTIAVFQYESLGMQRYMRQLKPDTFDDLIAMNALYRPGPLQYIPNFIARKHKKEPIVYDLPEMEEFLSNTYGITVYQEQVMLLAQKLAGFKKGEADILRKAMGKKQKHILDKMKTQFIKGALDRGYSEKILNKIWQDWEAFASYAFNKSHSTCYAYLAFQTAYLKAHYPAEYMSAVLSNNMSNIKEVSFLMKECRRLGISVLGPDINESQHAFSVNQQGAIRFGLEAVKGLGGAAVETILVERNKNGSYSSIFDLVKRVDLRIVNKKTFEALALSGAFDSFKYIHRAQYFHEENALSTLDRILRLGSKYQENKKHSQTSLFEEISNTSLIEPSLPDCAPWTNIIKLSKEKEVIGVYISAHPLDDYRYEIWAIKGISLEELNANETQWIGKEFYLYGIIVRAESKIAIKSRKRYGVFTLEDYQETREFRILGEAYMKFHHLFIPNTFIAIKISLDRWRGGELRIHFLQIQLLSEVFENLNKDLHLEIDLEKLSNKMIIHIDHVISKYKGTGKLKLIILDNKEKICLKMSSRKYRVHLERNLFMDLEKIPALNFHLK